MLALSNPLVNRFSVAQKWATEVSQSQRRRLTEFVLGIALLLLPFVSSDLFFIDRFGRYFVWAIFAISVDLMWGYGGMLTFGHAAFFGSGGYLVAIFTTRSGWFLPIPLWPALLLALCVVAGFAFLLASLVFRGRMPLRGIEFAVITLAIAYLLEQYARAGGEITGGQNGILFEDNLEIFNFDLHRGRGFYALAGISLFIIYLISRSFVNSRSGLVTRGIRGNEDRIELLGYNVPKLKVGMFVMVSVFAGFAGALFYLHDGIVSPSAVGVTASTQVLLWVALGGRGTLVGPIVGTIILQHLTATLSGTLLDTWLLIIGVLLIAVVMIFPSGILGYLGRGSAK